MSAQSTNTGEIFDPIRPDFADFNVPVQDSFDWDGILERLEIPTYLYVALYAFRSTFSPTVDIDTLETLDGMALLAAKTAQGFIHYQANPGLSYCLWESREDARTAIGSPEHRQAAAQAETAYEKYTLQTWLVARTAVKGCVDFVEQI